MKKVLLFLLSMCALHVTWAYDFSAVAPTGQTLYYNISGNNAVVTCPNSSFGSWSGYTTPIDDLTIPSSVTHNGQTYPVTSIGNWAFNFCNELTSVTIPNSVTSIGNYAFETCQHLTNVTIPNSVTSIGNYAFYHCLALISMSIPNSVTYIGDHAFTNCISLTTVTIPNSVTSIKDNAFYNCSSLTSITIPNSVTSIGNEAFKYCSSLSSVSIPNSVTSIGNYAFHYCSSLTSVTIGNSVTSIGTFAFGGCSGLTSVTIPNSVTSIGSVAFTACTNLKTVYDLTGLGIGTTSYGLSAKRVICPTKFGNKKNAIYKIPTPYYSFVDEEDNIATHIPRSTIPTNFIYNDNGWKAKEIILTDGQDKFLAPETFTAASATYTRDFTNTNRSTLYLPFSASIPEDLEVYDFSSFANNTLSFTEHSGNLDAYTPYLVGYDISTKDGSTTTCTISATNVTFPKSEATNYNPVTSNGMTFQGVIERTTMSSTSNYGYSNGYFVQSGGSAHVNPFRCYFYYSNAPAGAPPMLNVDIVDGEVGIEEAETIDTPSVHFYSTDVYDMMGRLIRRNAQSLEGLPTGVYIWKGQKVLAY